MSDFENKEPQAQQPGSSQEGQPQQQPDTPAAAEHQAPQGQEVPHLTLDPDEAPFPGGDPFQQPEAPRAPEPPQPEPQQQAPQYGQGYGAPQYGAPQYTPPPYGQYQPPQYGQPQPQAYYTPQYTVPPAGYAQRSRMAAGLLAIMLGWLGVHNFYLGFTSRAVAQLLISLIGGIFTCGLATLAMVVWAFVEGVMLLSGSPSRMYDGHGVILRD